MSSLAEKLANPFTSYSLNYEDVILRRLFPGKRSGTYVDVGAAHPIIDNDLYGFYEMGWRGVNIEANPTSFALLEQERPADRNYNAAVSATDGEPVVFFEVDNPGLSTCDEARAREIEAEGHKVTRHPMTTLSLATILQREKLELVDILKVDVEGLEDEVLSGLDWRACRPSVILIEVTLPESQIRRESGVADRLAGHGYVRVHFDGLNDFYAHETFPVPEDVGLPPGVFDGFRRREQVDLEHRLHGAESRLASVEADLSKARADLAAAKADLKAAVDQGRWLQAVAKASTSGRFDRLDALLIDNAVWGATDDRR